MNRTIRILADEPSLHRAAADVFLQHAVESVGATGRFNVALSGGSTPRGLYSLLADDAGCSKSMPWMDTHFFWGDERHVPPDHVESNFRMANETMLARVAVPSSNIHRIHGELPDARQAADDYEDELRRYFRPVEGQFPRFDFVLLGMGADGHTAGLFPNTTALTERGRIAVANHVASQNADRITLALPVFNSAAAVVFLVAGEQKAATLRSVLRGEPRPHDFPSQLVQPADGTILWLIERTAARLL